MSNLTTFNPPISLYHVAMLSLPTFTIASVGLYNNLFHCYRLVDMCSAVPTTTPQSLWDEAYRLPTGLMDCLGIVRRAHVSILETVLVAAEVQWEKSVASQWRFKKSGGGEIP